MTHPFQEPKRKPVLKDGFYKAKLDRIEIKQGVNKEDGESYNYFLFIFSTLKEGVEVGRTASATTSPRSKHWDFYVMLSPTGGMPADIVNETDFERKALLLWDWLQANVGNIYKIAVGTNDKGYNIINSASFESTPKGPKLDEELPF